MKKILLGIIILACTISILVWNSPLAAQESEMNEQEVFSGEIVRLLESESKNIQGQEFMDVLYEVKVAEGILEGRNIPVSVSGLSTHQTGQIAYQPGDKVMIIASRDADGNKVYAISDFIRRDGLLWLGIIFVVAVILVAGKWGIRSLIGLSASFAVIFGMILPLINSGYNPVLVAIGGASIIMVATFYLSHGFSRKTHIALLGTLAALVLTGILAYVFSNAAKLTGYADEEAIFLEVMKQGSVNIKGLMLAGIIIGTLGVLDDITISQSAVVERLRVANPKWSPGQVFWQAMQVGRDHIASLVNTLVLVYAGGAMPLLLMFLNSNQSFGEVINYEPIAEEIVRTLVGSIGLILAVPLTTFLAAYWSLDVEKVKIQESSHDHVH